MIEGKKYHAITKILSETIPESSRLFLEQWQKKVGIENAEKIRQESMQRGREIDENVLSYHVTGDCQNPVIKNYFSGYKIINIEQDIYSDTHLYKGRYDAILEKDGRRIINDNKGSGKPKKKEWLNDYPLQIAAYRAALLENGVDIDYGMISMFVGDKVQSFVFSAHELKGYFNQFLERLKLYNELINA